MLTLYYFPGGVSLAPHIALEETGLPYKLIPIALREGEQLKPAYTEVNPMQRVPVLLTPEGKLTEVAALLTYISAQVPDRSLLPSAGFAHVRAVEWLSLLASELHPPFGLVIRPARYTPDENIHAALKRDCLQRFLKMLQHVDAKLAGQQWTVGDSYTLCDAYAFVFYQWGLRAELPVAELQHYSALYARVKERPATQRALKQEGLAV